MTGIFLYSEYALAQFWEDGNTQAGGAIGNKGKLCFFPKWCIFSDGKYLGGEFRFDIHPAAGISGEKSALNALVGFDLPVLNLTAGKGKAQAVLTDAPRLYTGGMLAGEGNCGIRVDAVIPLPVGIKGIAGKIFVTGLPQTLDHHSFFDGQRVQQRTLADTDAAGIFVEGNGVSKGYDHFISVLETAAQLAGATEIRFEGLAVQR